MGRTEGELWWNHKKTMGKVWGLDSFGANQLAELCYVWVPIVDLDLGLTNRCFPDDSGSGWSLRVWHGYLWINVLDAWWFKVMDDEGGILSVSQKLRVSVSWACFCWGFQLISCFFFLAGHRNVQPPFWAQGSQENIKMQKCDLEMLQSIKVLEMGEKRWEWIYAKRCSNSALPDSWSFLDVLR